MSLNYDAAVASTRAESNRELVVVTRTLTPWSRSTIRRSSIH